MNCRQTCSHKPCSPPTGELMHEINHFLYRGSQWGGSGQPHAHGPGWRRWEMRQHKPTTLLFHNSFHCMYTKLIIQCVWHNSFYIQYSVRTEGLFHRIYWCLATYNFLVYHDSSFITIAISEFSEATQIFIENLDWFSFLPKQSNYHRPLILMISLTSQTHNWQCTKCSLITMSPLRTPVTL